VVGNDSSAVDDGAFSPCADSAGDDAGGIVASRRNIFLQAPPAPLTTGEAGMIMPM
jgi:hypothetical protein